MLIGFRLCVPDYWTSYRVNSREECPCAPDIEEKRTGTKNLDLFHSKTNAYKNEQDLADAWIRDRDTTNCTSSACFYSCPTKGCKKIKPSYLKCFQYNNLDNKIRCIFCKRQTTSYCWKCECGNKWHTCPLHGKGHNPGVLNAPKAKAKAKAKPVVSNKRSAPLSYEQNLLEETRLKQARIGPPTTISSTAHCDGVLTKMGPKIAQRFGYLLKDKEDCIN